MEKILESEYNDNIYEVIIRLTLPKRAGQEKSTIADFLSDMRAIVRVTIVDQIRSDEDPFRRFMEIKIKFNTKKMPAGMSVVSFVKEVLLPEIRKLDAKPTIKYIAKPRDHYPEKSS